MTDTLKKTLRITTEQETELHKIGKEHGISTENKTIQYMIQNYRNLEETIKILGKQNRIYKEENETLKSGLKDFLQAFRYLKQLSK